MNVSNDCVNWGSPVATGVGIAAPATLCTFPPQTARYIRMTRTGSATNSYWSIHEFNVTMSHSVSCGGSRIAPFLADSWFSGRQTYSQVLPVDTDAANAPAQAAAYQSERYGNMTYTLPNLTAGTNYRVRLHCAEIYVAGAGRRKFNVLINGTQVLSNFDVFATAGGKFKANVQEFLVPANSGGQIIVQFMNALNNAKCSAEVQEL